MLVHRIAIFAAGVDVVHLATRENGVENVHIGRELVWLIESLEVLNGQPCRLQGADGEGDAIFTRLPYVQIFAGVDAEGTIGVSGFQMPLSKCAQVFFDFFTTHAVVRVCVAGFDHFREFLRFCSKMLKLYSKKYRFTLLFFDLSKFI